MFGTLHVYAYVAFSGILRDPTSTLLYIGTPLALIFVEYNELGGY